LGEGNGPLTRNERIIDNQLATLTVRYNVGIRQATDYEDSLNKFESMRRTIQSYVEFTLFRLEESRFYDAVNDTFLGCSVRVK
jgi:hypothetical protein